tara:strand:- start:15846 stop:22658 length:6813 start_codon:yes stop_codon:yes gene_type:complete
MPQIKLNNTEKCLSMGIQGFIDDSTDLYLEDCAKSNAVATDEQAAYDGYNAPQSVIGTGPIIIKNSSDKYLYADSSSITLKDTSEEASRWTVNFPATINDDGNKTYDDSATIPIGGAFIPVLLFTAHGKQSSDSSVFTYDSGSLVTINGDNELAVDKTVNISNINDNIESYKPSVLWIYGCNEHSDFLSNTNTYRDIHICNLNGHIQYANEVPHPDKLISENLVLGVRYVAPTVSEEWKLDKMQASWNAHHRNARDKGCDLASITSGSDQINAANLVKGANTGAGAWIGAIRKRSGPHRGSHYWGWSDGSNWNYENWNGGEPNSHSYENRINMWKSGTWNDLNENHWRLNGIYKCKTTIEDTSEKEVKFTKDSLRQHYTFKIKSTAGSSGNGYNAEFYLKSDNDAIVVNEKGALIIDKDVDEDSDRTKFYIIPFSKNARQSLDMTYDQAGDTITDFKLKSKRKPNLMVDSNGLQFTAGTTNHWNPIWVDNFVGSREGFGIKFGKRKNKGKKNKSTSPPTAFQKKSPSLDDSPPPPPPRPPDYLSEGNNILNEAVKRYNNTPSTIDEYIQENSIINGTLFGSSIQTEGMCTGRTAPTISKEVEITVNTDTSSATFSLDEGPNNQTSNNASIALDANGNGAQYYWSVKNYKGNDEDATASLHISSPYTQIINGACDGTGTWNNKGIVGNNVNDNVNDSSIDICMDLCSADPTCSAIEINGCSTTDSIGYEDCTGRCYTFTGDANTISKSEDRDGTYCYKKNFKDPGHKYLAAKPIRNKSDGKQMPQGTREVRPDELEDMYDYYKNGLKKHESNHNTGTNLNMARKNVTGNWGHVYGTGASLQYPRDGSIHYNSRNTNNPHGYTPVGKVVCNNANTFNPNNYEYKVDTRKMTWQQHEDAAKEWGGHLVCIESKEENEYIANMTKGHAWLGGIRIKNESWPSWRETWAIQRGKEHWKWVDDSEWCYTNWWRGEPNWLNREKYLNIWHAPGHNHHGRWNDLPNTWKIQGVYKKLKPQTDTYSDNLSVALIGNNIVLTNTDGSNLEKKTYKFVLERPMNNDEITSSWGQTTASSTDYMAAHEYANLNQDFVELGDSLPTLFTDMTDAERAIYIANMDNDTIMSQYEGMSVNEKKNKKKNAIQKIFSNVKKIFTGFKEGMSPEEAYSGNLELKLSKIADAIESSRNAYDGQGSIITYPQVLGLKTKEGELEIKKTMYNVFKELYQLLMGSLFLCKSPYADGLNHKSPIWNSSVKNTGFIIQLISFYANRLKKLFDDIANSKTGEGMNRGGIVIESIQEITECLTYLNSPKYRYYANIFYDAYGIEPYVKTTNGIYYNKVYEAQASDIESISEILSKLNTYINKFKNTSIVSELIFEGDNLKIDLNQCKNILINCMSSNHNLRTSFKTKNMPFMRDNDEPSEMFEISNRNKTLRWDNTSIISHMFSGQQYGLLQSHYAYFTTLKRFMEYNRLITSYLNFKKNVTLQMQAPQPSAVIGILSSQILFMNNLKSDMDRLESESNTFVTNFQYNSVEENALDILKDVTSNTDVDTPEKKLLIGCFRYSYTNEAFTKANITLPVPTFAFDVTEDNRLGSELNTYYTFSYLIADSVKLMYDFFTNSCANASVSSALEKMASDVSEFIDLQDEIPDIKSLSAVSGFAPEVTSSITIASPYEAFVGKKEGFKGKGKKKGSTKKKEGFNGTLEYIAKDVTSLLDSGDVYTSFTNYVDDKTDFSSCSGSEKLPLFKATYNCGNISADKNLPAHKGNEGGLIKINPATVRKDGIHFSCKNNNQREAYGCNYIRAELSAKLLTESTKDGWMEVTFKIIHDSYTLNKSSTILWEKKTEIQVDAPIITPTVKNLSENGKGGKPYLRYGDTLKQDEYIGTNNGLVRLQMDSDGLRLYWSESGCVNRLGMRNTSSNIMKTYGRGNLSQEDLDAYGGKPHAIYTLNKSSAQNVDKLGYINNNLILRTFSGINLKTSKQTSKHYDFNLTSDKIDYANQYVFIGNYTLGGNKNVNNLGTVDTISDAKLNGFQAVRGSLNDVKKFANSEMSCGGFVYKKSSSGENVGILLNDKASTALKIYDPNSEYYVRIKTQPKNAMNNTCNPNAQYMDSSTWEDFNDTNATNDSVMTKSDLCGLAEASSTLPNESNSYLKVYTDSFNELTEAQNRLNANIKKLSDEDKKVLDKMGINMSTLENQIKTYKQYKNDFDKYMKREATIDAAETDTAQNLTKTNYMFILVGILLIILLFIIIRISSNKNVSSVMGIPIIGIIILLIILK